MRMKARKFYMLRSDAGAAAAALAGGAGGGGGGSNTPGQVPVPPPAPVAPPAATPVATPWGNADGTFTISDKPWYDALPEGPTRDLIAAKQYKNPQQLADAYHNAEKLLGSLPGDRNLIMTPLKEGASPEEFEAFSKKNGRLDNPTDYKFTFKEGQQVDEPMIGLAQQISHRAGLNPQQAQRVADAYTELAPAIAQQMEQQQADTNAAEVEAVKTAWQAKGGLEANVEAGRRAVQSLGLDTATLSKIENAMGASAMLDLFARLGSQAPEGSFTPGSGGGAADVAAMTGPQAQAEINRLMSDNDFLAKYNNADHPQHAEALRRAEQLYAKAG